MENSYTRSLGKIFFAFIYAISTVQAANQTISSFADTNTVGTLRYALNQQEENDIYTFSSSGTLTLTSAFPQILYNNLSFESLSPITLDGGGLYRMFDLSANVTDISFSTSTLKNSNGGNGGAIYFASTSGTNIIANTGLLTFKGNTASNYGGAIYSVRDLTITGAVTFGGTGVNEGNKAKNSSGAIFLGASANTLTFGSTASFINNKAVNSSYGSGGAISFGSNIGTNIIANTGLITFKGNTADSLGGAIYSAGDLRITGAAIFGGSGDNEGNTAGSGGAIYLSFAANTLTFESTASFINNKVTNSGSGRSGAIYFASTSGTSTIANTGLLTFTGNTAGISGGAIYSHRNLTIKGAVIFGGSGTDEGNSAGNEGGAIFFDNDANTLTFESTASFINNKAIGSSYGFGGAICFESINDTNTIANTVLLTLTGNAARYGGAIYSLNNLTITGEATFGGSGVDEGNTARSGGAIHLSFIANILTFGSTASFINNKAVDSSYSNGGAISFDPNTDTNTIANTGLLTFTGNSAGNYGGAIYSTSDLTITGAAAFTGNSSGVYGGAIYSNGVLTITGAATFGGTAANEGNTAQNCGGAIYLDAYASNTLMFDSTVSFINNKAIDSSYGCGGAIFSYSILKLTANDTATFSGNLAGNAGGAIYVRNSTLSLYAKGGDITFSGNKMGVDFAATDPSLTGTANSIYLKVGSTVNLAAESGKTIMLSDPIKATASTFHTVDINKLSDDTITTGKVIFSGANYAANSDHVKTNIEASTTVYGGTFSVTQKAEYGTSNSVLAVNSGAALMGSGYILGRTTLRSGSTLAAGEGVGMLTFDNLSIKGGSILEIESGDLINVLGTLDLSGASGINKILIDLINFEASVVDCKIMSMTDYSFGDINLNALFDFQGKFVGDIYALNDAVYLNGTVIPEPSTYAAILGLMALAFVIYRRRKA